MKTIPKIYPALYPLSGFLLKRRFVKGKEIKAKIFINNKKGKVYFKKSENKISYILKLY